MDKTQKKKTNFTNSEMETLVEEVAARKSVLFGSHSTVVTNTRKQQKWEQETSSIKALSTAGRTVAVVSSPRRDPGARLRGV